ncbi:NnrS protein involved in response to NO [hydrothermal vent metagenome]|uniref:NnrS protein involved in response to NO n=1 Tax=hydrothermal vent metagenome TaxID=652676 RepID=A0A3B0XT76_9ZZZZ
MKASFWNTFTAAPHRLFFFSGAIQLILPMLAWSVELTGRYTSLWSPVEAVIPTTWAHGFIMIYAIFIFFIFGFLMTVFPRWMNTQAIKKDHYTATFIWLNVGLYTFEFSLFYSLNYAFIGVIVFLFGWFHGIVVLYQSFKSSNAPNKRYETVVLSALLCGWLGLASYAWWIYSDNWRFLELSLNIGLWLYLLPLLFTVSHRMLPFFSSNIIENYKIYQPARTLWIFLAASAAHFVLAYLHQQSWLFIADIPLAAVALLHSIRWQLRRSFKDRLLAVLHMAFFWIFIGMTLFSIQSLILLFSGEYIINKAPLHAITIGFFTSLLVAMASRVTMGHSGRMLHLNTLSWALFLGLQLAAIMRIFADLQFDNEQLSHSLNLVAVALWLISLSTWFIKYAPMYLSRRVDDQNG